MSHLFGRKSCPADYRNSALFEAIENCPLGIGCLIGLRHMKLAGDFEQFAGKREALRIAQFHHNPVGYLGIAAEAARALVAHQTEIA